MADLARQNVSRMAVRGVFVAQRYLLHRDFDSIVTLEGTLMAAVRFLKSAQCFCQQRFVGIVATLSIAMLLTNTSQGTEIAWHKEMPEAIRESAKQHKPMLIVVGAEWCGPCHKMQAETFRNPAVATRIKAQFIPVLIDADQQAAFVEKLNVTSMPTVLVVTSDQRVIGRIIGFQSAAQLDARLASFQTTTPKSNPERSLPPVIRASTPLDTLAAAKQFSAGR